MKKILLIAFMLLSSLINEAWAQERTITGKITSEEEQGGLPGVSILIKGTTNGTISDIDGNYSLEVPTDAILAITYVGHTSQDIEIGSRTVIDIVMTVDLKELSEVIVTAVGIERQSKALGYSVENVDGDRVQQVAEPDPLRALQGKIPGVAITGSSGAPGSSTKVTIRGNSSMLGSNQPLFIVDGVPYNNDFVTSSGVNPTTGGLTGGGSFSSRIADLDPNNIESMTVLKGGAGAALYGSRAANGVILITTKTGSGTVSNKGLEVTFSTMYATESISNIPNVQNTYGVGTNFAYAQANGSWGAPFVGAKEYATLTEIPHWYAGRPGMEAFDGTTVPYQAYPNNMADLFQTGSVFENSVNISSGTEKSTFSATLSQMNQNGFVPNSLFKRHNISLGGKTTLDNGIYMGGNLAITRSVQDGPISGVGNLGQNNTSFFARALLLGRNWDVLGQPYENPVDRGSEFFVGRSNANNPFWAAENTGIKSGVDRYVASFNAGYDIYDWLSINVRLGMNTYNQNLKVFERANGANLETTGSFTESNVSQTEINSDIVLSANRDLNEDFNLNVIVGNNINQRTTNSQQINATGYVIFDIDDLDNMSSLAPAGGTYQRKRILGFYADATVGYKDYAFLTLTGRNDRSSTLPLGSNSFFYPAATVSWVLSDMLELPSFANFVKVRAGWSQVGNDTNPYLLSTPFLVNNSIADQLSNTTAQKPFNGTSGATLSNVATDPNLKPETTQEIEFGVDLKVFDRVGLNVTYYKRNSSDQIAQITVPDETGFRSYLTNFGEVQNKGIEIGLDVTPVSLSNGFKWNIFVAYTHNRNTIESLTEGVDEVQFGSAFAGTVSSVHRPGNEYGLLLGSVDARDDEGNLLIDPSNGQLIADTEERIIGNPNPDFQVGLTNTFEFKGFRLSAVLDWKQGGDLYSNQVSSMLGRGILASQGENREVMQIIEGVYGDPNTLEPLRTEAGEKIPNQTIVETNTLYFGQTFAANGSSEWGIWDATVIRLRELSLSYTIPKALLENLFIGSANIGIVGRNLWYNAPNFPSDSNYDPEVNQFGNRNQQGIEYGAAPSAKRYAVKLQITF